MAPNLPAPPPPRGAARRRTGIAIAALAVLWLGAMAFRWEIRTRWWAYRLTRTTDPQQVDYYLVRLHAVADRAVGAAGALLAHPSPEVRRNAVSILQRSRQDRARDLLLRAFGDPDADVREAAALGLALQGSHAALPELLRMIRSADEARARAAVTGLQHLDDPRAVEALIEAARTHVSAEVRAQAIDSLGLIRCRQAVPVLIEALDDGRPIRTAAASDRALRRALHTMGPVLVRHGMDPASVATAPAPMTVAELAARALSRITGESFGYRADDPPERKAAVTRLYRQWWERNKGT